MANFNVNDYIPETSRYHGVHVYQGLVHKFASWLYDDATQLSDRVFAVWGPFGTGKTWFLHYIEISAVEKTNFSKALPKKYTAQYIDWREAFAATTPRAFISRTKDTIASAGQPLCLCVDNIPGSDGASEDLKSFEEILHQALMKGAFLVLAQEDPYSRGWSQKIPAMGTEAYELCEFTREGVAALLGPNHGDQDLERIYEKSLGHPYLVWLLTQYSCTEACAILIHEWLKDRGLLEKREQVLEMAYPLSLISSFDPDWPQKKKTLWGLAAEGAMPDEWERHWKLILVEKLQWLTYKESKGKTIPLPVWYASIQKCLQECFKHEKPELYDKLQQAIRGGAA